MIVYALRRLGAIALIMLVICAITFAIFYLLPDDPALDACGKSCTSARLADVRHAMGLDQPVLTQFLSYLSGIFAGRTLGTSGLDCAAPCFGYSWQYASPVWDLLLDRLGVSASLAAGAAVLWLVVGVLLGLMAALRKGSLLDRGIVLSALATTSAPVYLIAALLIYFVILQGELLPFPDYQPVLDNPAAWVASLILPWITLAALYAAMYIRLTRASMIETMAEPYIRTARAKGLPERTVVVKHGLRSTMTPILTIFGIDLGGLLAGAMITETMFGLPGLGKLTFDAIGKSDQPVVLGVTLLAALFITLANLVVDLLYGVIDPRVRYA
ncbi:ABC transporter permease [Nonomuraea sp. SMC257]|uniref:ABC transporter permease n=1 Tax=Nonomuraea montanisoli TaxID=2741721 RepID=A0A7Y6M5G0_9ACTN|nr:ABC transporter permease [Nonomuraea montanisoli]NUW34606.1 ABC transporter permease [Nonomuraea montanisoli]